MWLAGRLKISVIKKVCESLNKICVSDPVVFVFNRPGGPTRRATHEISKALNLLHVKRLYINVGSPDRKTTVLPILTV